MSNLSVSNSLTKGLMIQLQPRMILSLVLPIAVSLLSILALFTFAWEPMYEWLMIGNDHWLLSESFFQPLLGDDPYLFAWLTGILSFVAMIAIGIVLGLIISAILLSAWIVRFIHQHYFPHLEKKGKFSNTISFINALRVGITFLIAWLITIPLWFIPFMPFICSIVLGGYVFSHMTRVDAIVGFATSEERKTILKRHRKAFWIIGIICALLALIPFVGLVIPVFSIIFCSHYALHALSELRKEQQ